MGESLDPELARALQEPARLVRADPRLLGLVRDAGPPAREQLRAQASEAGSAADRYASAAMLASLFGDRGPLDQAARGYGSAPPRELLALADVDALRPALRESLASPVHTSLLEWATKPDAANPPLELAMAARDLQLDAADVLRSVASRAEQLAAQTGKRGQRPPLERFAEILRQTAEQGPPGSTTPAGDLRPTPHDPDPTASGPRDAAMGTSGTGGPTAKDSGLHDRAAGDSGSGEPPAGEPGARDTTTEDTAAKAPRPVDPGRGGSGPRVTTKGIPASEMLGPDELDEPDPYDYPGTGVPVRDSIAGPRPGTDPRPSGPGNRSDRGFGSGAPGTADDAAVDPRNSDAPGSSRFGGPDSGEAAPAGGSPVPGPAVPRVPSTSEQYYGAGSDRYADHDPASPETRADDKHVLRNWGIVFLVIVAVIIVLTLLL